MEEKKSNLNIDNEEKENQIENSEQNDNSYQPPSSQITNDQRISAINSENINNTTNNDAQKNKPNEKGEQNKVQKQEKKKDPNHCVKVCWGTLCITICFAIPILIWVYIFFGDDES